MSRNNPVLKFFSRLFRFIITSFAGFFTALTHPFLQIFTGETVGKKIGSLLYYVALISLFFILRPGFFVVLILLFLVAALNAYTQLKLSWAAMDKVDKRINDILHEKPPEDAEDINEFYFYGMSEADAKKTYRELLRKYHPDNTEGSEEMTMRINKAYELYENEKRKKDTKTDIP